MSGTRVLDGAEYGAPILQRLLRELLISGQAHAVQGS
jgi:hypothetical protein